MIPMKSNTRMQIPIYLLFIEQMSIFVHIECVYIIHPLARYRNRLD